MSIYIVKHFPTVVKVASLVSPNIMGIVLSGSVFILPILCITTVFLQPLNTNYLETGHFDNRWEMLYYVVRRSFSLWAPVYIRTDQPIFCVKVLGCQTRAL